MTTSDLPVAAKHVSSRRIPSLLIVALAMAWGAGFGAAPASAESAAIVYVSSPDWHVPFTGYPYEVPYFEAPQIDEIPLNGGTPQLVESNASAPAFAENGVLAFDHADPLDSSTLSLDTQLPGEAPQKMTSLEGMSGPLTLSPDGSFAIFPSYSGLEKIRLTPGGAPEVYTDQPTDMDPAWASDDQIAFSRRVGQLWQLFVARSDGRLRQITHGETNDLHPSWSPDSSILAFDAESRDRTNIYTIHADGTRLQRLTNAGAGEADEQPAWSPNGSTLAFSAWGPFGNNSEIMTLNLVTSSERQLTDQPGDHLHPTWVTSPLAATTLSAPSDRESNALIAASRTMKPVAVESRHVKRYEVRTKPKLPRGLKVWLGLTDASGDETCDDGPTYPWDSRPLITLGTAYGYIDRSGISDGEFNSWAYATTHDARMQSGTAAQFCFTGLGPKESASLIRTTLIYPSGRHVALRTVLTPHGPGAVWTAPAGTTGRFRMTARRGSRSVSTTFQVVPADTPHIVQSPRPTPPGVHAPEALTISVAGQSATNQLALDIYVVHVRRSEPQYRYLSSASLPYHGRTSSYLVATPAKVRPAQYLLVLRNRETVVDAEPAEADRHGRLLIDAGALP